MTKQEVLNQAKAKYQELKQEQERINQMKDRLEELEQDERVKEYFELVCDLDKCKELTQNEICCEVFSKMENKDELDKIYYKFGYYIRTNQGEELYTENLEQANLIYYINLVTKGLALVDINEEKNFEEKHNIIHGLPKDQYELRLIIDKLTNYYSELILTSDNTENSKIMEKLDEKVKELKK